MRVSEQAKANARYYQKRQWHFLKENDPIAYQKLLKENRERHKTWASKKLSIDPEYFKKQATSRLEKTFEQRRRRNLMTCYGITVEQYEVMERTQRGRCAICEVDKAGGRAKSGKLYVDHDHKTKKVRGLLCNTCNSAIGLLRDDPNIIMKAAQYLQSFYEVKIVV